MLALASPFEEVVGPYLPVLVKGVLLPINGRIIYDGLLSTYRITFGPGIRRSLNADFKRAKDTYGIITSLPEGSMPPVVKKKAPRKKPAANGGLTDLKDVMNIIVELTDSFCEEYLNGEYADLCRKLAATLARKRPSPLLRGQLDTWACGIIRTIGWVNFLDDSSQTPHLKLPSIDRAFGVAESTGTGQVEGNSQPAEDPPVRSEVDTAQQDGRQSDGLDGVGQRFHHGHPPCATGTSDRSVREGTDPVHPRRSWWRFGGGRLNRWENGKEDSSKRASGS